MRLIKTILFLILSAFYFSGSILHADSNLDLTSLTDAPDPQYLGQDVTFNAYITNGGAQKSAIQFTATFDMNVTFVSFLSPGLEVDWNCTAPTATSVECTSTGQLGNGKDSEFSFVVTPSTHGILTTVGTIVSTDGELDIDLTNNTKTTTTEIIKVADLGINKSDLFDPVLFDTNVSYQLDIINNGPEDALNLVMVDVLDGNTSLLEWNSTDPWACSEVAGVFTCTLPTLAASDSSTIYLTVKAPAFPTFVNNEANISSDETDLFPINDKDSEQTFVADDSVYTFPALFNINAAIEDGNYVGTVPVVYLGAGSLTYSITGGNADGVFDMNSSTGVITIANAAALDYPNIVTYNLSVHVESDIDPTNFSTNTVTINVVPEIAAGCETFPKALNVFWNTGTIDLLSDDNDLDVLFSPNNELNVYDGAGQLQSPSDTCNYGPCAASNRDTRAINMPPFPISGDPCSPTVVSDKTKTNYFYADKPTKYTIEDEAGIALSKNALEILAGVTAYFAYDNPFLNAADQPPFVISCLTVRSNGTLQLEPGEYFVETLTMEAGASIEVIGTGDGSGTARLYFNRYGSPPSPVLQGNFNAGGSTSSLLLGAYDDDPVYIANANISGYIHSASSTVYIGRGISMFGAVTAKDIRTTSALGSGQTVINYVLPALQEFLNGCVGGTYTTAYEETDYGPFVAHDVAKNYDTIFTKKANEYFNFSLSHLSTDEPAVVQAYTGTDSNSIYVQAIDDVNACTDGFTPDPNYFGKDIDQIGDYVRFAFATGDTTINMNPTLNNVGARINTAEKTAFLRVTMYDFGDLLLAWEDSGLSCAQSSTTGNLEGVPQCLNTVQFLTDVGYGHCAAFCDSNDPYAKAGGCFECIVGKTSISRCSDSFAVRPDKFNIGIEDLNLTNRIVAGEELKVTFEGLDVAGIPTSNYNEQTDSNATYTTTFKVEMLDELNASGCVTEDFNTSLKSGWSFTNGSKIIIGHYDNVGIVDINISEDDDNCSSRFSATDCNDTAITDTDTTITPFEVLVAFTPFDFEVNATFTNAHIEPGPDGNFTYLSNFLRYPTGRDANMSGRLDMNITAMSQNDKVTTNYNNQCYSKDVNISVNFQHTLPANTTLTKMLFADANDTLLTAVHVFDLNSTPLPNTVYPWNNITLSKDTFNTDRNGTAEIGGRFNFDRSLTQPHDPFTMRVEDVTARDVNGTTGFDNLDQNVTYYFGRIHAPRYRVDCSDSLATCTRQVPFYYEVYASTNTAQHLTNVAPNRLLSVDDIRWYRNEFHDSTQVNRDGHVYSFSQRNTNLTEITALIPFGGKPLSAGSFTYNGANGYPYKSTIDINATDWLTHHRFNQNATVNRFELEFNSLGGWTGLDVGSGSVDSNASINTNRRIEW